MVLLIKGTKSSIFGYISRGDIVPDVNITELYDVNTGFIAILLSKQENVNKGSLREPSHGLG